MCWLGSQLSNTPYYPDSPKRHEAVIIGKTKRTCFVLLLLSCVLLSTFCRMPRLHTVWISTLFVTFFFVPAVLYCAVPCSAAFSKNCWSCCYCCIQVLSGWLGSACLRSPFTPLIIFTMYRQVHTYIRKNYEVFRCACCAAVDQSKSEVATRAWNHDIYAYAGNHVCCVIQTLGVCIIWGGPDHHPPYYKTIFISSLWKNSSIIMRQGRGSEATEAVFAFRQKSLFLAGRKSVGCQK